MGWSSKVTPKKFGGSKTTYKGPTSGIGSAGRGEYQNRSSVWNTTKATTKQDRASVWANSSGSSSSGGGSSSSSKSSGGGKSSSGGGGGGGGGWAGQPRVLAPNAADTPYRDVVQASTPWKQAAEAKATDNPTLAAVSPGSVAKPASLKPLTKSVAVKAATVAATAKPRPTGSARPMPPKAPAVAAAKPGYVSGGPGVWVKDGPLASAKPLPMPKAPLKPIVTKPGPNVPPPRPQPAPNPGGLQPGGGWKPPRDTSAEGLAARPMPSKPYRNGRGF